MSGIASKGQLRLSFLRWAMVTVPSIMFLGLASGLLAGSGEENRWYAALEKSSANPPGYAFGIVWPILYLMLGLALASILHARGAKGRGLAIMFFIVQLVCNLLWSPLFFGAHEVTLALYLLIILFVLALVTVLLFGRIRPFAAWMMVPYLCWLGFATGLNYDVHRLNPDAETLAVPAARTQI